MKIVGVDASLTGTGIAIYWDSQTPITATIKNPLTGVDRLIYIRDYIKQVSQGADLIVIEGYAFARANQAHQIGELGGVLRTMFHEMGLKVLEVAPAAVKKFATGKGNATKEQVAVGVFKRWSKEFGTNDEADAFVLMKIGEAILYQTKTLKEIQKIEFTMTSFQSEVIDEILKPKVKRNKKAV